MKFTYNPGKRAVTLAERKLDFLDAAIVFEGLTYTAADDRWDYGEKRYVIYGLLHGRMVVVVWTPRGAARHVFSIRNANDREQARHKTSLG